MSDTPPRTGGRGMPNAYGPPAASPLRWWRPHRYEVGKPVPPIRCPLGHDMHVNGRGYEGAHLYTCPHVYDARTRQTCGRQVFVIVGFRWFDGKGGRIDVEATHEEMAALEKRGATLDDVLDYLCNDRRAA